MSLRALRILVGILGAGLAGFGATMIAHGVPGWGPLALGVLILIGLAFERWRYRRLDARAPAGFEATPERFLDPATGAAVTVYVDRRTGERRYVRD